jgi:hypothetical protein
VAARYATNDCKLPRAVHVTTLQPCSAGTKVTTLHFETGAFQVRLSFNVDECPHQLLSTHSWLGHTPSITYD